MRGPLVAAVPPRAAARRHVRRRPESEQVRRRRPRPERPVFSLPVAPVVKKATTRPTVTVATILDARRPAASVRCVFSDIVLLSARARGGRGGLAIRRQRPADSRASGDVITQSGIAAGVVARMAAEN